MPKHELVAIDIDGTLVDQTGLVSRGNRRSIRAVQKRGVQVTLATGRTFQTTEPFIDALKIKLPVICYHGALIRTRQKIYFSRLLPAKHVQALMRFGFRHRVQVALFSKEQAFFNKPIDRWAREYINNIEPVREVNLVDLKRYRLPEPPHKAMFIASERKLRAIEPALRRRFGHAFYMTRSHGNLIEFLHPHVSKGRALRWIAHHLGLRMPQVMAIGDAQNDVSMLWMAGLGVAVKNASPEVKRKVDWVTSAVDKDGVAVALRKFILKTGRSKKA
jgi:Cof subfamily protein (haloacid dehalogenase superfamily)